MKRCPSCGRDKPEEAFGRRKRGPSSRKSWCRACEATAQQKRYAVRCAVRRIHAAERAYEEMWIAQAGACAICHEDPGESLLEDLDPATGRVRRLLCASCNTNPKRYERAVREFAAHLTGGTIH